MREFRNFNRKILLRNIGQLAVRQKISSFILVSGSILLIITLLKLVSNSQIILPSVIVIISGIFFQIVTGIFTAISWKNLVNEHSEIRYSFLDSLSHTGVLFIGKYLPGSVFGLLSRELSTRDLSTDIPAFKITFNEQILFYLFLLIFSSYSILELLSRYLMISFPYIVPSSIAINLIGLFAVLIITNTKSVISSAPIYIAMQCITGGIGFIILCTPYLDTYTLNTFLLIHSCFCFSILIGVILPVFPAGIGIRESGIVFILAPHLSFENAIAIAALSRLTLVVRDLIFGGMTIGLIKKKKQL